MAFDERDGRLHQTDADDDSRYAWHDVLNCFNISAQKGASARKMKASVATVTPNNLSILEQATAGQHTQAGF